MSPTIPQERRAAFVAVLLSLLVGVSLWGLSHVVGRSFDPASVAERSRWLDEPLRSPATDSDRRSTDRRFIEARRGATSRHVKPEEAIPAPAGVPAKPDRVEAHDLSVPRHALLVDEHEIRRSVAELETLADARASRASALGEAACGECGEGRSALDSQGAAARDALLSAKSRLLSRAEAMERDERSLRFVSDP